MGYPCVKCTYNAFHNGDPRRHMNSMHKILFTCFKCRKEFGKIEEFQHHNRVDHEHYRVEHKIPFTRGQDTPTKDSNK